MLASVQIKRWPPTSKMITYLNFLGVRITTVQWIRFRSVLITMKLPMMLLWKRHLRPLLNGAGAMSLHFCSLSFTLFFLKFGRHVSSYLQNVLANFFSFFFRFFCKLVKCGWGVSPIPSRMAMKQETIFIGAFCGQCVTMPKATECFCWNDFGSQYKTNGGKRELFRISL